MLKSKCENWQEAQNFLFQLANFCFLISCLTPDNSIGILIMHGFLGLGGLLLSSFFYGGMLCYPDKWSWIFITTFINICQLLYDLYRLKPVRLEVDMEIIFNNLFQPLGINRATFKKIISSDNSETNFLSPGEFYAIQNITRVDRLSLLISGKVHVVADRKKLHTIEPNQFIDSPEFESSRASLEDKFRVSIVASTSCRFLSWQRSSLEYLFVKEEKIANVFSLLIARDVISKVYAMNKKLADQKDVILDIRLAGLALHPLESLESVAYSPPK